nr:hypothetical protein [Tanacetum cinerariifolium]
MSSIDANCESHSGIKAGTAPSSASTKPVDGSREPNDPREFRAVEMKEGQGALFAVALKVIPVVSIQLHSPNKEYVKRSGIKAGTAPSSASTKPVDGSREPNDPREFRAVEMKEGQGALFAVALKVIPVVSIQRSAGSFGSLLPSTGFVEAELGAVPAFIPLRLTYSLFGECN